MTRGTNRLADGGSIKMNQVLVNGIKVAYEDVGAGENVLVLVHGHPFNRTMWRPQVEWIASLNLNRVRDRSERAERLDGVGWPGDKGPTELVAPPNLEDEDDYGMRPWRVIVPDLR